MIKFFKVQCFRSPCQVFTFQLESVLVIGELLELDRGVVSVSTLHYASPI